ncbi:MAG TPA: hypothetical protein PKW79_02935 [Rhabdochlamydiaceae bacterium]|nr:hypothetical protein [Rhabdochlamydiaceae bacterium]
MGLQNRHFIGESWLARSWWVIAFVILGSIVYFSAMHHKNNSYKEMLACLYGFEKEKALAVAEHQELILQIDSQSDPAWVEMVLKRNLGLVPEGQVKVYFKK